MCVLTSLVALGFGLTFRDTLPLPLRAGFGGSSSTSISLSPSSAASESLWRTSWMVAWDLPVDALAGCLSAAAFPALFFGGATS